MKKYILFIALFFGITVSLTSVAQNKKKRTVLFVLTSHDKLGDTGKKTGFWIEEFATPYYTLIDKNVDVIIASPKGGQAPIDPKSNDPAFQTESTKRYYADAATQKLIQNTKKLSEVNQKDFDAIFYPGGHGPMWDLYNDAHSIKLIESFYANHKPVAFVCHGSAALANAKDKNGNYLVNGKKVTGFCNTEEEAVQLTQVVPFSLENKLKERGALYVKGNDWSSFAVVDGLIISGQNPQSSALVAEKLLSQFNK